MDEFVHRIAHAVQRGWPEIIALIGPLMGDSAACLDKPRAPAEFGTAATAVHIQASTEAMAPDEAARIRHRIVYTLCRTLGVVRHRAIEQYESAWRDSMIADRAPLDGVARLLSDRWRLAGSAPRLRLPRPDPLVVVVLGTMLLTWATPGAELASGSRALQAATP